MLLFIHGWRRRRTRTNRTFLFQETVGWDKEEFFPIGHSFEEEKRWTRCRVHRRKELSQRVHRNSQEVLLQPGMMILIRSTLSPPHRESDSRLNSSSFLLLLGMIGSQGQKRAVVVGRKETSIPWLDTLTSLPPLESRYLNTELFPLFPEQNGRKERKIEPLMVQPPIQWLLSDGFCQDEEGKKKVLTLDFPPSKKIRSFQITSLGSWLVLKPFSSLANYLQDGKRSFDHHTHTLFLSLIVCLMLCLMARKRVNLTCCCVLSLSLSFVTGIANKHHNSHFFAHFFSSCFPLWAHLIPHRANLSIHPSLVFFPSNILSRVLFMTSAPLRLPLSFPELGSFSVSFHMIPSLDAIPMSCIPPPLLCLILHPTSSSLLTLSFLSPLIVTNVVWSTILSFISPQPSFRLQFSLTPSSSLLPFPLFVMTDPSVHQFWTVFKWNLYKNSVFIPSFIPSFISLIRREKKGSFFSLSLQSNYEWKMVDKLIIPQFNNCWNTWKSLSFHPLLLLFYTFWIF